jgi:hypothetical protein
MVVVFGYWTARAAIVLGPMNYLSSETSRKYIIQYLQENIFRSLRKKLLAEKTAMQHYLNELILNISIIKQNYVLIHTP